MDQVLPYILLLSLFPIGYICYLIWKRASQRNEAGVEFLEYELIGEVNNGGFLQYFVNSGGDHWRDALSGMSAMGMEHDRELFQKVLDFFQPDLPNEDRDKRYQQIAKISKREDKPFASIETEFYADVDGRKSLLLRYIAAHAEEFRIEANE